MSQENPAALAAAVRKNCILVCEVVFYACFKEKHARSLRSDNFQIQLIMRSVYIAGRAYWKGRSQISTNKLGLPSTDGIDQYTKPT